MNKILIFKGIVIFAGGWKIMEWVIDFMEFIVRKLKKETEE